MNAFYYLKGFTISAISQLEFYFIFFVNEPITFNIVFLLRRITPKIFVLSHGFLIFSWCCYIDNGFKNFNQREDSITTEKTLMNTFIRSILWPTRLPSTRIFINRTSQLFNAFPYLADPF